MSNAPGLAELVALGKQADKLWAGSIDPESRGLVEWVREAVSGNRGVAVGAALAACELVVADYPNSGDELVAPRPYVEGMMDAVRAWREVPNREHQEAVRARLNVTRTLHAWQGHARVDHFWVVEAIDHLCLAVWSGEASSYIAPLDFATCAARSAACVAHALIARGQAPATAYAAVVAATERARG